MAAPLRQTLKLFVPALLGLILFAAFQTTAAQSQDGQPLAPGDTYHEDEILKAGHKFFGSISGGLASVVEKAFSSYGEPNGYILGEEGTGAFFAGARYGEGSLYTRNAGTHKVFWQGPSFGFDFGADGARTMILVYNLPDVNAIFDRFGGVNGSAYLVGGIGMTVLVKNELLLVPIRAGVGAHLGVNMGYLKFTPKPTWNPF